MIASASQPSTLMALLTGAMKRWQTLSLGLTVAAFVLSLYMYLFLYDRLPQEVPIHWNFQGEADGWVPKSNVFMTFFLLPAAMVILMGLDLILPWVSPRQFEVQPFRRVFDFIMALAIALMGYIHGIILWTSLHPHFSPGRLLVGGILVFFVLVGTMIGRVRRNFWMGVRTPWTLASDEVWKKTHHLAGWMFAGMGLLGLVLLLAGVPLVWCLAVLLAAALVPVGYSLILYKWLEKHGKL